MISKALGHYPHIRFREDEKLLWNPVLRKSFKVRPEERVRLQLVEYFLSQAGYSRSRMSFETPVKLQTDKTLSRTDLICYDDALQPYLLCECKSNKIALDEKSAQQISRYNTIIGAPYLLISNGITDYWFEVSGETPTALHEIPEKFSKKNDPIRDTPYWAERGFLKADSCILKEEASLSLLVKYFADPYKPVKYLHFEGMPPELGLEHYYAIHSVSNHQRIAITFSATPTDSRFNAILNTEGNNVAYLSISLSDDELRALGESASGKQIKALKNELLTPLTNNSDELIPVLHRLLTSL
ncbi:type I restriction enzyme HsdR N-terminal domain-containing protein [Balneola sp. MJW-20]|uniref:type I restriction enzyme HsdR N-terminal domain-containing protein n=1 Tax=Gracilimonas aurantiaca TaxID=3234185 RepID=UPI003466FDF8